MLRDDFWSVELGTGMGPLLLGLPLREIEHILKQLGLELEDEPIESNLQRYCSEIDTFFHFSDNANSPLIRMDIESERLRFGSLQVHGMRIHELVDLLAVPPQETLWCDFYDEEEQQSPESYLEDAKEDSDKELIGFGTLWITTLGLGLSLENGKVAMVHLCQPEHTPRIGTGMWTDSQKELSKQGLDKLKASESPKMNLLSGLLLIGLFAAFGFVIWQAIALQTRWNKAQEVQAEVVAVNPPPPNPFPDEYTVTYQDSNDVKHQTILKSNDIYGIHAVGDLITIRFLTEEPDRPLGPTRFDDVGFNDAVPKGLSVLFVYLVLSFLTQLLFLFKPAKREG